MQRPRKSEVELMNVLLSYRHSSVLQTCLALPTTPVLEIQHAFSVLVTVLLDFGPSWPVLGSGMESFSLVQEVKGIIHAADKKPVERRWFPVGKGTGFLHV